jgi:hypothetical protein
MASLDDPGTRQTVIETIEGGGTLLDAARAIGFKSRQVISRYAKRDPAFALDLETAQARRGRLQHQLTPAPTASAPRIVDAGIMAEPAPDASPLWTREQYLERLQEVADDAEHPASATAWRLLGGWHLEAPIAAKRRIAEREADEAGKDNGAVQRFVLELPEHAGEIDEGVEDVIDAEVIE